MNNINLSKGARIGGITILDTRQKRYSVLSTVTGKKVLKYVRKCKCDCGTIVYITNYQLRNRPVLGCKECHYNKKKYACANIDNVVNYFRRQVGARDVVHKIELTDAEITELIQSNCFYCGAKPNNNYRGKGYVLYSGIDRLDSKKGYTTLNSVPCCKSCNFMKQTTSLDNFLLNIKNIYENIKLQNFTGVQKCQMD